MTVASPLIGDTWIWGRDPLRQDPSIAEPDP